MQSPSLRCRAAYLSHVLIAYGIAAVIDCNFHVSIAPVLLERGSTAKISDMQNYESLHACSNENERLRLHFVYMFVIFTLAFAFLMSDRWTDKQNFTEYLTNIGTFVSLVLGIVAIFYSFISNSTLSQNIGNISKTSEEVTAARVEIGKVLDHAVQLQAVSTDNMNSLHDASRSVGEKVGILNDTLFQVAEKTEALHLSIKSIPDRFDKLETRLTETTKSADKPDKLSVGPVAPRFTSVQVDDFINYSSVNGRLLVYACMLANSEDKELSINSISSIIGGSVDYIYGYFVAMNAFDIVDKRELPDKDKTFKIIHVDENLKSRGVNFIPEFLEKKYRDKDKLLRSYKAIKLK